jgi:hypothetical protein
MNPHAHPKRMTVAQLLETIMGKAAVHEASIKDATPFTHFDRAEIGDVLERFGFQRNGEEVLYNGFTGEQLRSTIFIGPVYYQRLKHMVKDKVHARSTGRVNNLTRQSVEGRSSNGGLRLRDKFLAYVRDKTLASSSIWSYTSKIRETPAKVSILNKYGNIFMATGKTSRYSHNLKHRDNPLPSFPLGRRLNEHTVVGGDTASITA